MALTRKFLKAMGIEDEKIDQIIEAHTETVSGLKDQIDTLKADAGSAEETKTKLADLQKRLDKANSDLESAKNNGLQGKYDSLKKEFEDYKAGVTAKETKAAKAAAARAYYARKNIKGDALEIAMLASGAQIEGLELTDDGEIKSTEALDALVSGKLSGLVSTTTTTGANTATPPANNGGGKAAFDAMPLSERMKYANEHPTEAAEYMKP